MESPTHNLSSLGQQLGLSSVEAFISQHAPLAEHLALADAPFWSVAQAAFLSEQLTADADWAEVIDQLDLLLRRPR
jgi:hypothetical protein